MVSYVQGFVVYSDNFRQQNDCAEDESMRVLDIKKQVAQVRYPWGGGGAKQLSASTVGGIVYHVLSCPMLNSYWLKSRRNLRLPSTWLNWILELKSPHGKIQHYIAG